MLQVSDSVARAWESHNSNWLENKLKKICYFVLQMFYVDEFFLFPVCADVFTILRVSIVEVSNLIVNFTF